MFVGQNKRPVFEIVQDDSRIVRDTAFWENHNAVALVHAVRTKLVHSGSASGRASVNQNTNSFVNHPKQRYFFQFFFTNKTQGMVWEKYDGKHDVHDGGMIGDNHILQFRIYFLLRQRLKSITKTHPVE